jgi:chorismate mutase/prephenate dehydratase
MDELKELRGEIDAIDRQIADLLQQRMDITYRVGQYKQRNQMQVLDEQREKQVLDAKTALSDDPNMQFALTTLFETIMSISRKQQRQLVTERDPWYDRYQADRAAARAPLTRPRVLYQGEPGAYADEAAARFFGEDIPRDRVATWEEVFLALKEGRADYGVVPIENSSTGSINQVYDLLGRYGAYIVGEQTVKVDHCLMAPKGARLDSLTDVYSHEQGLSQCTEYLKQHPAWTGRAMLNTAAAAKYVAETGDVTKAAIGSRRAAGLYGLEVLAQGINFNADNYTRFVVVSPVMELRPQADKISALFTLPHRSGTLHRIMSIFAVAGLNMMKLESRPVLGKSWEYLFFVDFTGNLDQPGMDGVLHELTQASTSFRVLGNYKASGE